MVIPTCADDVQLLLTLFERFLQAQRARHQRGHPFVYPHQTVIVCFLLMQPRRIFRFNAMRRWWLQHPEDRQPLGLEEVPDRTTRSRRYKALDPVVQGFMAFLGQYAEALDPRFDSRDLYTDKSLFNAQGPIWPQADRMAGRVPAKLRHLDPDASWSKSGSHGWVSGDGVHLTDNRAGFPKLAPVETGAVSESPVLDEQAERLIHPLGPDTLPGDDRDTRASRLRQGAKHGVLLLAPALKWVKGSYAPVYHRFITQPENADLLHSRRTAIEPVVDLVAKVLGTTARQKPLPIQRLAHVRTCLVLATLTIHVAMIANRIWGLPLRNISTMAAAFT
jgi:hypothetical protein